MLSDLNIRSCMLRDLYIRPTIRNSDFVKMFDYWNIPYTKYNSTPLVEELRFTNAKCNLRMYGNLPLKCTSMQCDDVNYNVIKFYIFNPNENISGIAKILFRDISVVKVEDHGHKIVIMSRDCDEPWLVLFV